MKLCKNRHELKNLNEFTKSSYYSDGHYYCCKSCRKKQHENRKNIYKISGLNIREKNVLGAVL